jgi:alpha-1,6-mannosyltransferase
VRNFLSIKQLCLWAAFVALTVFLGFFAQRDHFGPFAAAYGVFLACYVWVVFFQKKHLGAAKKRNLVWLGVALRVLLLFSLPNLSDDCYRFLWDGRLALAGIHPFAHPPTYFVDNQFFPPGTSLALFQKLNSPEYFTVYPPVCQAVFAAAAWLAPQSDAGGIFWMKLFLLACESGTIFLLGKAAPGQALAPRADAQLLYALNPLAILEIVGNCHFEGAMIFFLVSGFGALRQHRLPMASSFWALATAAKLMPPLFLPVVWKWLGWRKGLWFNVLFGAACLILFAPLLPMLPHMAESLDLYFRQFQFNASVYYLVRAVGFRQIGWDIGEQSGPWLGAATAFAVLLLALWTRPIARAHKRGLPIESALLFASMLYLSLSATVQPWYATVPLVLCFFTPWRFPVLWSGLVALSYSHYDGGGRQEHFGLIALEYSVLGAFFIGEIWWRARRSNLDSKDHFSS